MNGGYMSVLLGPLSSRRGVGAVLLFSLWLRLIRAIALRERPIGRLNTSRRPRIHCQSRQSCSSELQRFP